jgi:hypothetical protein
MHSMQLALVSQAPEALSLIRIGPPEPVRPRRRQNRVIRAKASQMADSERVQHGRDSGNSGSVAAMIGASLATSRCRPLF